MNKREDIYLPGVLLQASTGLQAEQVNARYKQEHAILMDLLISHRNLRLQGTLVGKLCNPDPAFCDLFDRYVIDASKRGIRT